MANATLTRKSVNTKMISGKELKKALSLIKPCLSKDRCNPILGEVAIITRKDGTWLGGTDGRSMCLVRVSGYNGHDSITAVSYKLLADQKEGVDLKFADNGKVNQINDVRISGELGTYPDLWRCVPAVSLNAAFQFSATKSEQFYECVSTCEKTDFYVDIKSNAWGEIEINNLCLRGQWTDGYMPEEPARYNRKLLTAMAKACKSVGDVDLVIRPKSATVASNEKFVYLIMPLRIR